MHQLIYPVDFMEEEDGSFLVRFPDFPEAVTFGEDKTEAVRNSRRVLNEAIFNRMRDNRRIPLGRKPEQGQALIVLATDIALKVVTYTAQRKRDLD